MSPSSRAPKLLAYLLAVPFLGVVYLTVFFGGLVRVFRPALTPMVGAAVITKIYTGEAFKRPRRKHRLPAAVALGLAVVLVGPAVTRVPVAAAQDPQQAVVDLAMHYVGYPYVFGAEGPNKFDCSGLIYWLFKEAGELPRIGGSRMGATAYMRWFVARGRWSRDEADARPGDLVVWKNGHHIGIYVGPNRAVSALNEHLGVRLHDLRIPEGPSQYLLVNWGTNDGGGGDNGGGGGGGGGDNGGGGGDGGGGNPTPAPTDSPTDSSQTGNGASNGSTGFESPPTPEATAEPTAEPTPGPTDAPPTPPPGDPGVAAGQAISQSTVGTLPTTSKSNPQPTNSNGVAIATVNLREQSDVTSRILGWVGSGAYVKIVGTAFSPEGNLYYKVTTASGASGWVYSHWVLRTP
ncbi:MAG: NlpC/P60 family protein [Candidatus Limnocylindrales bacterium]